MLLSLFQIIVKITGWKYVNKIPADIGPYVMVGAPHTSNYDFIPAMGVAYHLRPNAKFVIKSDWLKFPMGSIFKALGAIGVNRELIKQGKVESSTDLFADLFKEHQNLVLMISPEGTRSPVEDWKSGFYYIAQKAGVPIVLGYADYAKKEFGLGMVIYPSEFESDMKKIADFYRDVQGCNPSNFKLDKRFK